MLTSANTLSVLASAPSNASTAAAKHCCWSNVDYDKIQGGCFVAPSEDPLLPRISALQQARYADPADYQIARLRNASTSNQLRGRDCKAVSVFYNFFVDVHKIYSVPLKILDDICIEKLDDESESLIPLDYADADPSLLERYSVAIYARLEEDGVLDSSDPLYTGLLEIMYNSRRDRYARLKAILGTTLMVHAQDLSSLSASPTAQYGSTPFDFACRLNDFYRGQ